MPCLASMLLRPRTVPAALVAMTTVALIAAGCSPTKGADADAATAGDGTDDAADAGDERRDVFDSSVVHEISISFDESEYQELVDTYTSTGEKVWIEATVTIDGETYEAAGIRLKGNSSLRGLGRGGGGPGGSVSAAAPQDLPWLVRLDEYVDEQNHDGIHDLVVRSNSSETALNEAVALDLLERAGLPSQDAIAASFSVNGSAPVLRLVVEHPDDAWMADNFDDEDALYKAESTGDYSYRGPDPETYDEVFDQEAGEDNADLAPLIDFLDFVNNSDDQAFEAELADWLDIDSFASYLAMQDLLDNFDDIDGPGNNSYLHYDTDTGIFTVVPWDHNLAFGGLGGPGGDLPGPAGLPDDIQPPEDLTGGDDLGAGPRGGFGGPGGRSNVLVQRFLANPEWVALYEQRGSELEAALYDSGVGEGILAQWVAVIESSGLVDDATITSEADRVASYF